MDDNKGYIKIYRKMLDNPVIMKDSDHLAIFTYLLLNATFKEIKTIFDGNEILLKKGELVTGRKIISEKLKINENKTQRVLDRLEKCKVIEQQKTNRGRLISIKNWCRYQSDEQHFEQQMNNKRTTSEQQVNTIQECNKENKVINIKERNIKERKEKKEFFDCDDWMDEEDET